LKCHYHPTVRLWAEQILDKGHLLVDYSGDPLLDFSISNFLDRISYKEPKSQEKLQKFREKLNKSLKMASYEKPANAIDFSAGALPEIQRVEEEFMYKYLREAQKKQAASKTNESDVDLDEEQEMSDPEMEAFAEAEIRKEMKRL
jgi:predicted RND superfamily exporter protein